MAPSWQNLVVPLCNVAQYCVANRSTKSSAGGRQALKDRGGLEGKGRRHGNAALSVAGHLTNINFIYNVNFDLRPSCRTTCIYDH